MSDKRPNIVLIGFMGSGKSTVGKHLAQSLHYHFCDTDQLIEDSVGKPIYQVFDDEGEAFFRELETKVCSRLPDYDNTIISTGGGIISNVDNRKFLQQSGFVVYLYAPLDTLLERIPFDGKRPLLKDREGVKARYTERQPWYDALANFSVDTSNKSIDEITRLIVSTYTQKYLSPL